MSTNSTANEGTAPLISTRYYATARESDRLFSLYCTTLQADSLAAKQAFLSKSGRERRNQDRQRARFMTKEEQEEQKNKLVSL